MFLSTQCGGAQGMSYIPVIWTRSTARVLRRMYNTFKKKDLNAYYNADNIKICAVRIKIKKNQKAPEASYRRYKQNNIIILIGSSRRARIRDSPQDRDGSMVS